MPLLVSFISLIYEAVGTLFALVGHPEVVPVIFLAIIVLNDHGNMAVRLFHNSYSLFAEEALVEMYPVFDHIILVLPLLCIC